MKHTEKRRLCTRIHNEKADGRQTSRRLGWLVDWLTGWLVGWFGVGMQDANQLRADQIGRTSVFYDQRCQRQQIGLTD